MTWFEERLYEGSIEYGYSQRFEITRVVHQGRTVFQDVMIFETPAFGRVLALDGIVQATERDAFIYHEMLVHVPLFAHGGASRVLIVGGGDGGTLREVLRHDVARATMVELDRQVVDVCRQHLPALGGDAFDDPRAELIFADADAYMGSGGETFDVIIVDSTDPIGPGEVLFSRDFYGRCRKRLNPGGILVTQNGVPFFQPEEVTNTFRRLGSLFPDVSFFTTPVPTYVGGLMALGWASDDSAARSLPKAVIAVRFAAADLETGYYTPDTHVASFALPPYISRLMH